MVLVSKAIVRGTRAEREKQRTLNIKSGTGINPSSAFHYSPNKFANKEGEGKRGVSWKSETSAFVNPLPPHLHLYIRQWVTRGPRKVVGLSFVSLRFTLWGGAGGWKETPLVPHPLFAKLLLMSPNTENQPDGHHVEQ